eukprot:TRINITY_DN85550_c0_g1_i1.p1 TRINITY_DN85550_c0_g1~~TRINITY_DN85550_c0_g1_i1.p1  ORF type:complete len:188 (+),score=11.21 TRINITY_DN85550_c0_g1_i1:22-564(+)
MKKTRRNSLLSTNSNNNNKSGNSNNKSLNSSTNSLNSNDSSPNNDNKNRKRSPSPNRRGSYLQPTSSSSAPEPPPSHTEVSSILRRDISPSKSRSKSPPKKKELSTSELTTKKMNKDESNLNFQARLTKAAEKSADRRKKLLQEATKECTFQPVIHTAKTKTGGVIVEKQKNMHILTQKH